MQYFTFFLWILLPTYLWAQCNGSDALCNKRYNEVVYVTTHNAFNYEGDFMFPNQSYPIAQQLTDGVRAFMLDVYLIDNIPYLYHGFSVLGTQALVEVLTDMQLFLADNPNEVITIILECYVEATAIADALNSSNLMPYLHTQVLDEPWPSLQTMIDNNQRLVLLSDVADSSYDWYHYMWDYAVETDYSNHALSDLTCDFNRGQANNELFILNSFITSAALGIGIVDSSALVNSYEVLHNYCLQCIAEVAKLPNFLTVDFYELGDVFAVADSLNHTEHIELMSPNITNHNATISFNLFPNPVKVNETLHLQIKSQTGSTLPLVNFELFDVYGHLVGQKSLDSTTQYYNTQHLPSGLYYYRLSDTMGNIIVCKALLVH